MNYNKPTLQDIEALRQLLGTDSVHTGDSISADYAHDELQTVFGQPDLLLFARSKEDVRKIMAYANERVIPVTVRGSGTGLVGAAVPIHGGILLDMSKMNRILELDRKHLTLTVEPGALLLDIAAFVEAENLMYAPDPGEKTATIGGNVATNAGGMRAVKYGVTRDWIRGLEVVLADGSLERLGSKAVKNSTGYALKDLLIGSEGTLGVITEIILKLMPKPKRTISLLVPFDGRSQAIRAATELLADGILPTGVEFFEKDLLAYSASFLGKRMPHHDHAAYLLFSFDGDDERALAATIDRTSERLVDDFSAVDVYTIDTSERMTDVWSARGAFLEAIKSSTPMMDECDVVLPRGRIGEYLEYVRDIAKRIDVRTPYFGHIGDGNLHIYICQDDRSEQDFRAATDRLFALMYEKAASFGGLVSGEHGIGYIKKAYMKRQLGERQVELMRGIKRAFDPKNILNPGKVID
ncbi:MAG: FAD-binding oxidoreductase [Acholeplasmataceae bacterium]